MTVTRDEPLTATPVRVSRAAVRVLSVPAVPVIATVDLRFPSVFVVLLRLEDSDGAVGYGCLWSLEQSETPLLIEALRFLAPVVTGSTSHLAEITSRMLKRINFLGLKGVTVFGLSAFDMALHDLLCRRLTTSLSALLGRVRDSAPSYWSGLYLGSGVAELEREVETHLARGFRFLKMRVGHPDGAVDLERVAAVASILPQSASLALDAVQAWTTDQALAMCNALARWNPAWIEDPLLHSDYRGLQAVNSASPVPIATGENEYLPAGFEQLLSTGPRYVLPDLQRVGGISGWLQLVQSTSEHSVILTPHVYPQIALQLVAALPYESVVEYVPWWDELSTYQLSVDSGRLSVPDTAGTGLDLAPDAVEHFAISGWLDL